MIGAGEVMEVLRNSGVPDLVSFKAGFDEATRALESGKVSDETAKYEERLANFVDGGCDAYDRGVLAAYAIHATGGMAALENATGKFGSAATYTKGFKRTDYSKLIAQLTPEETDELTHKVHEILLSRPEGGTIGGEVIQHRFEFIKGADLSKAVFDAYANIAAKLAPEERDAVAKGIKAMFPDVKEK